MFSTTVPLCSKFLNAFYFFIISNVTQCFRESSLRESSLRNALKTKIAFRGNHVFKGTTWNNVEKEDSVRVDLETNKLSKNVGPLGMCDLREKSIF